MNVTDIHSHGYPFNAKREFWSATSKIRNDMDALHPFHEANARAQEQAAAVVAAKVNTLWVDRLCGPWFGENA